MIHWQIKQYSQVDSTRHTPSNHESMIGNEGDAPVELQPLVVSPKTWMWNPCMPGARPVTLPLTSVYPSTDTGNKHQQREEVS